MNHRRKGDLIFDAARHLQAEVTRLEADNARLEARIAELEPMATGQYFAHAVSRMQLEVARAKVALAALASLLKRLRPDCEAAPWVIEELNAIAATRLNAGPHKGEGRGMHQVENGRSTDYYAGVQAGLKSYAWDQDGTDMVGVAGTPLAAALDEVEAIHRAAIGADDTKPDQELPDPEKPGKPGKPDHELPDPERPGRPERPDHALPGKPGDRPKPDQELPEVSEPKGRRR